jgi:hypothetical protein
MRNAWKVSKCGAGEGRKTVGSIMWQNGGVLKTMKQEFYIK